MKINEFFDDNLNPLWDKIWELQPFKACIGVQQNKEWHRETVDEHIHSVTLNMMGLIRQSNPIANRKKLMLMTAALCHDLGKATTTYFDTELQQYKCKNHGLVGERITRQLLFDEPDIELREAVCWIVRYHMTLHRAKDVKDDEQALIEVLSKLRHMPKGVDFNDMIAMYVCDCMGSKNVPNDNGEYMNDFRLADEWHRLYDNLERDGIEKSDFTAYLMVGVAGSGKSTWILENIPNVKVLSRDIIREELGMSKPGEKFKGTRAQEDKVTEVFNKQMLECAKNHHDFVIDNMNLVEKWRRDYHNMLKDYRVNWHYVYVEAPTLETNMERRKGQIADTEITKMLNRLDFPRPYEYDEFTMLKQH